MSDGLQLTVVRRPMPMDHHRGVVRLSRTALTALGVLPQWPVTLTGARTTGALAAIAADDTDARTIQADDLVLENLAVASGALITVARCPQRAARELTISAPAEVVRAITPEIARFALLGKVVTAGDKVSFLQQDYALPEGVTRASLDGARTAIAGALGDAWQGVLLEIVEGPLEPSIVGPGTTVTWRAADGTDGTSVPLGYAAPPAAATPSAFAFGRRPAPAPSDLGVPVPMPVHPSAPGPVPAPTTAVLPGLEHQAAAMREWFELGFHRRDLLATLGTQPSMGVLLSGPAGSGKQSVVEAVAAKLGATVFHLWGPALTAADVTGAANRIRQTIRDAEAAAPSVLVVEDVEAIAPRESADTRGRQPLGTLWREELEGVISRGRIAIVCTTTRPEEVSVELLHPGLLEHELALPLPDRASRRLLLTHLTRAVPLGPDVDLDEVATRTPGFVYADLTSLVRQAGLAAAGAGSPVVRREDLIVALEQVRPTAMADSDLEIADVTLDDVGDMVDIKQALTEAVLWPLRFPETFTRMGVSPPRGVLMYGPPGCGKTYLVKALAGTGEVNVLSVKGAELMNKYVGESEAGVRELFRRAREAAPSLIFLDEVDALAPIRGQTQDSGVTDRVVAALLTELDGVEELRQVVVVAATNRPDLVDPALTRPGRLERLVYVPPPDADARVAILTAAARTVPLDGVDLQEVAAGCDGFSAADLAALVREAAMTAMRRSMESTLVTAADVAAARSVIRGSLDPSQVAALERFAALRAARG